MRTSGPGALPRLLDAVVTHEHEIVGLARRLFAAWLDQVVRLEAPVVSGRA
jgi:hypothetical protein